jgi:hypothetical protein
MCTPSRRLTVFFRSQQRCSWVGVDCVMCCPPLNVFSLCSCALSGNEDTEQHTHTFSLSGEVRDKYESLRLVVNTNTLQPIAIKLHVLALGWLGSHEVRSLSLSLSRADRACCV